MRHLASRIVVVVALLSLGGMAWAAGVPWKRGGNDEPVVASTLGEMKSDLGDARFQRVVGPIEAKVALADKAMEAHEKEMQKAVGKRQSKLLQQCKVRAAQMHLEAAKTAMRTQHMVQKKNHKACIQEHFEEPNKKKGIRILLGLASEARTEGNLRQSALFYKQVLGIDPENSEAKVALKELAREYQQALQGQKNRSKSSGGGSEDKRSWEWDYDSDHNRDWGNWRNYDGSGGGGGGSWW